MLAIIALLIVISKFRRSMAFRLEARGPQVIYGAAARALDFHLYVTAHRQLSLALAATDIFSQHLQNLFVLSKPP